MWDPTQIEIGIERLRGDVCKVGDGSAWVVLVHGSGNHREGKRNAQVARMLQHRGLSTVALDLLTPGEAEGGNEVYDVDLLTGRLLGALDAISDRVSAGSLGLFAAGTACAAALHAAARRPERVQAIASRGGRPDLAGPAVSDVHAPTLLIVGSADTEVLALSRVAHAQLRGPKRIDIVPRATHLFQEAGAIETVAERAGDWFVEHLRPHG
jgi:putative phosphoribosyl transferase